MAAGASAATPLLPNKLFRPVLRPELVARPRLVSQLETGWQSARPLTLVVAPAGYGKTTLVAAWARKLPTDVAVAWLTLDKADNDPVRFFTYLTAALSAALPGAGEATRRLLALLPQPVPEALMMTLLGELPVLLDGDGAAARKLLLVLDDYHHLQSPALHDAVRLLAENAPATVHVTLVTREDPPLPVPRWRVRDQLTEIRAQGLRFSEDEAAHFLEHRSGQQLEWQWVAALTARTEGWAAGLQLAALALRGTLVRGDEDTASFVADFSGSHRYVIDYLVEEVLSQLQPALRNFLTGTAMLDRLCAPLCAAVLDRDDGASESGAQTRSAMQSMLESLEEANLFLVPLDDRREWYRYHQLFADCLRAELDPAARAEGHRRAAAWFAAQDLYAEAIDHAAAAGDTMEMARLVRLAAGPAFQAGKIGRISSWLEQLPEGVVLADPELAVYRLLSLILGGHSQEAPAVIFLLDRNTGSWNEQQRARLLAIKAWVADITDSAQRISLAQKAAAALGDDDPLFSAFIAVPLGHAYLYQGSLRKAVKAFQHGLALAQTQGATFARLSLVANLIHALNLLGRHREAWVACERAIADFVDARGNPLPPAGLPFILRGWLNYEAGDLDQARADVTRGGELLRLAFQDTLLTPLQAELPALLHEAAGEPEQALAAVREGRERALRQQYRQAVRSAARVEADLLLRHGQLAAVRRWADGLSIYDGRGTDGIWCKVEAVHDPTYLTYVRLLWAEDQVAEARTLLPLLADSARQGERERSLISILLLQAAVAEAPQSYLQEALQRAAAQQYGQLIVDECAFPAHGPKLKALLSQDVAPQTAPVELQKLLEIAPATEKAPSDSAAESEELPLADPLTEQERVVLKLLLAGLSNGEIASELVISTGTAKWHVHNVYSKLGVHSRVDAVLRAQELGLG